MVIEEIERFAITNPWFIAVLLVGCALVIFYGRVDIAVGAYGSIMFWAYNVDVGPTNLLWIMVGAIVASIVTRTIRGYRARFRATSLSRHDADVGIWMALWSCWMLLIYAAFPSPFAEQLVKNTVLYNLLSFTVIFLFVTNIEEIQGLIYAFILTSTVTGLTSLWILPVPLLYALEDPSFQFRGLTGINYLTFAIPFSLSTILVLTKVLTTKRIYEKMAIGSVALFLVACVILTGARQSMVGLGIAIIIVIIWCLKEKQVARGSAFLIIIAAIVMSFKLYTSTRLWERWTQVSPEYQLRSEYWSEAWHVFLKSPIWGNGWEYWGRSWAHNLLLDVMASQGMVGVVFLIGFVAFTLRAARGTWNGGGNPEIATWRIGMLCAFAYTIVQTAVTGGLPGDPHFFWISALIWRLGMIVQRNSFDPVVINLHSSAPLTVTHKQVAPRQGMG